MASRRAHRAAIAVASDGSVLLNVAALLPPALQAQLGKRLGAVEVFVGVALTQRDARQVIRRLDDSAAEASAHLLGGRSTKKARSAKASAKPRR
jgi:hypothetical protein